MTRHAGIILPLLTLMTLSCGLFAPVITPTPGLAPANQTSTAITTSTLSTEPAPTSTPNTAATAALAAALTQAAAALPRPVHSPTPGVLVEEEIPMPPPALSPGAAYQLKNEWLIGAYGIRYWHDPNSEIGFDDIVLIERSGAPTVRIEMASAIEPLTGADINGDGFPEVIIETYSGGAHCCLGTQVYSLRDEPLLILKKPESNTGGQFVDLDADDIYEFVTYDDIFAYQYCAFAGSPIVKVIMAYDETQGSYLPASPRFSDEYLDDIAQAAVKAENAQPGDFGEWDETTKCAVLPLVLNYLYLGETKTAHTELLRFYTYADAEDFWAEVLLQIQDSFLYVEKSGE